MFKGISLKQYRVATIAGLAGTVVLGLPMIKFHYNVQADLPPVATVESITFIEMMIIPEPVRASTPVVRNAMAEPEPITMILADSEGPPVEGLADTDGTCMAPRRPSWYGSDACYIHDAFGGYGEMTPEAFRDYFNELERGLQRHARIQHAAATTPR